MGEHGSWGKPSGLLPNGLQPNDVASVTRVLDADRWSIAEKRTDELIACIQPNVPSEKRREDVANYVRQLIMKCFSCEVFTFGSVPLKTYLPDGDIDLTAFSPADDSLKDTWANAVRDMLDKEEKSERAEFRVKEVQYIQAEVKIVKCLVENIVVDISFNQLGGLCTLCFLDEVDSFIGRNHIFKRSIILIKAWCYYESRILGAHHGLISTYALETLVLYIFHVFNNSFAGPLEVLHRFLVFFSNFEWDKFCVSLWGPISISSLPEMIVEPPRKDTGKVLLDKDRLATLSAKFSVPSSVLENHGQHFVSKHFNVVDPLRTNNNLGRSVSKGNFFRIRSAFAFGAKRLARLLECPKEDIVAEVNRFFMNTWGRHGSGRRPDIPPFELRHMQTLRYNQVVDMKSTRNATNTKKKVEKFSAPAGYENLAVSGSELQNLTSEFLSGLREQTQNMHIKGNLTAVSHTQSQNYNRQMSSRVPDQLERNHSLSGAVQGDRNQKSLKPLQDQVGQLRFQFVRTRSSPELTETSLDLSRGRRGRPVEPVHRESSADPDYGNARKNLASEGAGSTSSKSFFDDPMSARHIASHRSLEVASDSNSVSNSFHTDIGFRNMMEALASVNERLEIQQEEQDMVNMMGPLNMYGLNGSVQLPMHLASPHLPLGLSPIPTSVGYTQRDSVGVVPTNLPIIGPPWGSNMQFPHGLVSSPLAHYFYSANPSLNGEDKTESSNEGSGTMERPEDIDLGIWHEHALRGFSSNENRHQMLHLETKHQKSHVGLDFAPLRGSNPGVLSQGQSKLATEDKKFVEDDNVDLYQNQTTRGSNSNSNSRGANSKLLPVSPSTSRSKPASDNMRDVPAAKSLKSARERWGKKPASSVSSSTHGKGNSDQQYDSSSVPTPRLEDEVVNWIPLSTAGTDMAERIPGSASLASSNTRTQQLSSHEPPGQISGSDPLIPFGPMLVGTSRPRGPVTFFPTGPPVPFVMVPIYNFASNTGNADGSANQYDREEILDKFGTSSDQNLDSLENLNQSEVLMSSDSSRTAAHGSSDERNPDILNSDLASHLQNLAYGRSCQNLHYHAPVFYQSPLLVPPAYLQGHHPWDGPGRPVPANLNFTQLMGYGSRMVPVIPIQPGPDRSSGSFQRYGDEPPRYRGGTGTYLPNPKVSFRDRQSNSRNHRGNYHYDRNEQGDRDGNWNNSKQRSSLRSQGRNHVDRASGKADRLATGDKQGDRPWEPYRHENVASFVDHSGAMGSNASHASANMLGIFPENAPSSNGVGPVVPPVMMVYSYDQGAGYHTAAAAAAEPLEFGSLGPMHLSSANEAPQMYDRHSTYREGSPQSSPEEPSSPQLQR